MEGWKRKMENDDVEKENENEELLKKNHKQE